MVSAGFDKDGEKQARLPRNIEEFEIAVKQMVTSVAIWKGTYWNEFGEGTAIEPSLPAEQTNSGRAKIDDSPETQADAHAYTKF